MQESFEQERFIGATRTIHDSNIPTDASQSGTTLLGF